MFGKNGRANLVGLRVWVYGLLFLAAWMIVCYFKFGGKEEEVLSIMAAKQDWGGIYSWLNRVFWLFFNKGWQIYIFKSLLALLVSGEVIARYLHEKRISLVTVATVVFMLPFVFLGILGYPQITLGVVLVMLARLVKKGQWLAQLLAVVLSLVSGFLVINEYLVEIIENRKIQLNFKRLVIMGVWLTSLCFSINDSFKQGNLAKWQFSKVAQGINFQLKDELVASKGINLVPLKLKRIVFNKPVIIGFEMVKEYVDAYDFEAWFFAYNQQQDLVWQQGLTPKNVFMVLDWVGFIVFLAGVFYLVKKNRVKWLSVFIFLGFLNLILGKYKFNEWFLLTIPIFWLLTEKVFKVLSAFKWQGLGWILVAMSFIVRMDLLLNNQLLWIDNRLISYRFIGQTIKEKLEQQEAFVSSGFGPAKTIVDFYYPELLENKKIIFGDLPNNAIKSQGLNKGVYAGLASEIPLGFEREEVWGELKIKDQLTSKSEKKIKIINVY